MRYASWLLPLILLAQTPAQAPKAEPDGPSPVPYARGFVRPDNWDALIKAANDAPGVGKLRAAIQTRAEAPLPASYIYKWASPVKNQGQYGNCWDFATCGVVEAMLIAAANGQGAAPDLSEQYVVNHINNGFGCNGGDVAFDFLQKVGTATEADCPYRGCKSTDSAKPTYKVKAWGYVGNDSSMPDVPTLKSALLANGPLCVAVGADSGWDNYKPGQVITTGSQVNHEVVIYGWDDSKSAWLVRNSWGTSWGDQGYCWIRWGAGKIGTGAAFCSVEGPDPAPTPGPAPGPSPGPAPGPTPAPNEIVAVTPVWVPWNGGVIGLVNIKASPKDRLLIITPPSGGK